MRTKLVIFDSDGVLVDSEPLIKQAVIEVFAKQGITLDEAWCYENLNGMRADDVLRLIREHVGPFDEPKSINDFKTFFGQLIRTKLKTTPNILAQLEKMTSIPLSICVGSNDSIASNRYKLETVALSHYFKKENIFSSEQVANGKPAPDLFLFAAKSMEVAPQACVVVEDAAFGIKAAKAAGMYAIGYLGGSHVPQTKGLNAQTLKAAGADVVIFDHNELLNVIP